MGSFPIYAKTFLYDYIFKILPSRKWYPLSITSRWVGRILFRVTYVHDINWSIFSFTMAFMRLWVTLKVFCSKLYNFCLEASHCKRVELSTSPTLAEELLEAKKGKGSLLSSYAPGKVICASIDGPTLSWCGRGNLKRKGVLGDMLWTWVVQDQREARGD